MQPQAKNVSGASLNQIQILVEWEKLYFVGEEH